MLHGQRKLAYEYASPDGSPETTKTLLLPIMALLTFGCWVVDWGRSLFSIHQWVLHTKNQVNKKAIHTFSGFIPPFPFLQILDLDDISQRGSSDTPRVMMPVSTEVRHSNMDAPRSPVSISTDSSRRGSLKQVLPEMHSDLPTPNSPRTRLTRKRAASLNTDSANEPRIGDLALNSASTSGLPTSDLTREQVCLCQPDPKIPRPRNGA